MCSSSSQLQTEELLEILYPLVSWCKIQNMIMFVHFLSWTSCCFVFFPETNQGPVCVWQSVWPSESAGEGLLWHHIQRCREPEGAGTNRVFSTSLLHPLTFKSSAVAKGKDWKTGSLSFVFSSLWLMAAFIVCCRIGSILRRSWRSRLEASLIMELDFQVFVLAH